uniref:Initiator Rep protein WH1 domain-containing protein n=1 Tax=Glossina brevipalpis TaxID=37001 RepID=A0A1A9VZ30_9MUSC
MPLTARRVLFLIMAQIDPKHLIKEGQIFEISAKDYAHLCSVDIDTAYQQLKKGARLLHNQSMEIPQDELLKAFARRPSEFLESEKNWRGMRLLHITDSCSYIDMEAIVQVRFSRQMEPYICMIEKDFTTQILLSSVRISDTNATCVSPESRRCGMTRSLYSHIARSAAQCERLGYLADAKICGIRLTNSRF